jgi:hypothetical protein
MPYEESMDTKLVMLDMNRKKLVELLGLLVDLLTTRDGVVVESELCYSFNDLKACAELVHLMEERVMRMIKKKMRETVSKLRVMCQFFVERKRDIDVFRCKTIMLRMKIAIMRMRRHKDEHGILKQRLRRMENNIMFGDLTVVQGSITPLMSLFQIHYETEDVFVGKIFQMYS